MLIDPVNWNGLEQWIRRRYGVDQIDECFKNGTGDKKQTVRARKRERDRQTDRLVNDVII